MAELTNDDMYLEPTIELSGENGLVAAQGDVIICVSNCGPPPPRELA